ncbi:hypothetical protein LCGC14_1639180 [marine sediment metagenome]|uniref:Uncharacterized protein n=1 Tax=marine sediment metagenome TaxID=412755 RepID=A0A0F9I035_9ZZZZ
MKPEYDFSKGKRGAIDLTPDGKTRITIRLDDSVINWFRTRTEMEPGYSPSGDYHERINEILRLRRLDGDLLWKLREQSDAWHIMATWHIG